MVAFVTIYFRYIFIYWCPLLAWCSLRVWFCLPFWHDTWHMISVINVFQWRIQYRIPIMGAVIKMIWEKSSISSMLSWAISGGGRLQKVAFSSKKQFSKKPFWKQGKHNHHWDPVMIMMNSFLLSDELIFTKCHV